MFTPILDPNPSPADWQFIEDQINQFNMAATGYSDFQPLAIFVRDDAQQIIAGLTGFSWGKSCVIVFLWVHEEQRRAGYGTALLQMAEDEARRRDCLIIVLGTHSFQAPDFYSKHGYSIVSVQEDFPAGHRQISFSKRLD